MCVKLQVLVYHILASTTAVFSYATKSRKLSANEQFFVGAQTVVSLLQTTQTPTVLCILQSQFIEKGFKKAENSEQNVVLLLFLFTLNNSNYMRRLFYN